MVTYKVNIESLRIGGAEFPSVTTWSTPTQSDPLEDLRFMVGWVREQAWLPPTPAPQIMSEATYWALYGAETVAVAHGQLLSDAIHNPRQCTLCQARRKT